MQETPSPKVLVVDDSEQNRALAEETLRLEGCDVVTATTGEQALEAFVREEPDLVLLDATTSCGCSSRRSSSCRSSCTT